MADKVKKTGTYTDIFAPTTGAPQPEQTATPPAEMIPQHPADNSDLDRGRIVPNGVGISEGERDALDAIGARYDIARNALIRYAVRRFLVDFRAGKIDLAAAPDKPHKLERRPKRQIVMPK